MFVDLTVEEINGEEVLTTLLSLDLATEVVLIAYPEQLEELTVDPVRTCYGCLHPNMRRVSNAMVLNQLTEKLQLQQRLEALKNSAIIVYSECFCIRRNLVATSITIVCLHMYITEHYCTLQLVNLFPRARHV